MSTKLYIGNLPETCRRIELQKLFDEFGTVVECDIVRNYGFVHYADEKSAKAAAENLNGKLFEGVNLKVEISHSKVRQKPGMGGKGECYRCGKEGHWSKDCPKGPSRPRGPRGDYRGSDPYPPPRDPYDPYFRDRYPPPPPPDRYRPYPDPYDRRPLPPPPPRDPYFRDRDPYARPPPEYYGRRPSPPPRDPYYQDYFHRRSYPPMPPPPGTNRTSPRGRAPPPY